MEKEVVVKLCAILEVLKVFEAWHEKQMSPAVQEQVQIFNNASLGKFLNISLSTIKRWRKSGKLKFTEVEGTPFYLMEDVLLLVGKNLD